MLGGPRYRGPSPATVMSAVALFVALGGVSYGATGGNFILGQANTASSSTALAAPFDGSALRVTNTNATANATALTLVVGAGRPPFTVNTDTKVNKLNADRLDGIDSTAFWKLGGNAGTSGASFLGTPDAQPLVVKTNGVERLRVLANGNVGVGTSDAEYRLHVGTNGALRVEGPSSPGGQAVSVGGFGDVDVDAPGVVGGRFTVTDGGRVGIGNAAPQAKLHVVSTSTNAGNNTAEFDAPSIGPNASHVHWGTNGDWYIRSANSTGKVVMQDSGGNVGVGTANPTERLSVAGTVQSTSGGFKFPDGSVQGTAAPNTAYTTRSAPALDTRQIADVDDAGPTELAHLDLPAGTYLLFATADFANAAGFAFQDNSRLVKCMFFDEEFRFHIQPGGGGFFGRSTSSWQIVKILGAPTTTVSLACRAYTGGTDGSSVYGNATRITALKLPSVIVQ
jgi:hypothetical protein